MERTLGKGQQGLEISDWTAREDDQHIKARIGKDRQEGQNTTARTGQLGQENRDGKAIAGQP
jgi:hypothetical protein